MPPAKIGGSVPQRPPSAQSTRPTGSGTQKATSGVNKNASATANAVPGIVIDTLSGTGAIPTTRATFPTAGSSDRHPVHDRMASASTVNGTLAAPPPVPALAKFDAAQSPFGAHVVGDGFSEGDKNLIRQMVVELMATTRKLEAAAVQIYADQRMLNDKSEKPTISWVFRICYSFAKTGDTVRREVANLTREMEDLEKKVGVQGDGSKRE